MVTQAKIDFYLFIYLTGSLKAGDPTVGLEGPICHQGPGSFQRFTLLLHMLFLIPALCLMVVKRLYISRHHILTKSIQSRKGEKGRNFLLYVCFFTKEKNSQEGPRKLPLMSHWPELGYRCIPKSIRHFGTEFS